MHCAPRRILWIARITPGFQAFSGVLGATGRGRHPAKQEKVPSAQLATIGKQDPVDGILDGMADLATFNVSGTWTEAGVRVGDQTFRAWPMPASKPGFFSLFAFAWNMPSNTVPLVYASNGAGNDVTSPIVFQFPKKEQPKYTVHDLPLNDAFIQKVVGELDPRS